MDNQKQEKITLESLYAYLHESEEISNREFAQMREEAKKRSEEFDRKQDEIRSLVEENARTIREMNKKQETTKNSYEEINKTLAEAARIAHENSKTIGSIGNNNGEFAEEYFQSAFRKNPRLNGETYNEVITNLQPIEYNDDYDIFLSNEKSVAIIEIKYSVRTDDIGKLLKKAENFRKFLHRYNDRKLYLGIASLSFRKITEKNIINQGIAVIKQVGDKMVVHDKNLKVF
ncbi:MAG: hypothetical protein FWH53_07280 [Leptospirales bacterium]|nr:hypothetical protein [Leptospirales bacterium]